MSEQQLSRQQRRELARKAAKQASREGGPVAAVPVEGNGEEPAPQPTATLPIAIAPKYQPSKVETAFDVSSVYDNEGREWKLLTVSTPQGVQWYFIPMQVADQLAEWLKGTAPSPASKLIIPGVSVRPDMFKPQG